ncbi:MAG TPA: hypothetical protein VNW97_19775 [Candidatus Saccharimonadales bacterium]|jgi:hypothetical protein|nr:hypothetical protein [Candidatus Saccharimonadales bacterium]
MTIFGFNTDVRHGETVYHVQSEVRQTEVVMQTMVFVKGQCVAKRVVSYANAAAEKGFSEEQIHELIKLQHKSVIDAISEGRIDSVRGATLELHAGGGEVGLSLQLIKTETNSADASIIMYFHVSEEGKNVSAEIVARAGVADDAKIITSVTTGDDGNVGIHVPFDEDLRREAAITVRATHNGKSATRRFRLKKNS